MEEQDYMELLGLEPDAEPGQVDPNARDEGDGAADKPKPQSKEENSQFAAARRKAEAERDEAIAQLKEQNAKETDELIAGMGLENPYTNKPITNRAEYDEYRKMHDQKRQDQRLRDMGMTADEYQQMVQELPEVKEAKAKQADAEKIIDQQKQQQMREWVAQEMQEIQQMNPAIQSVEDLRNDPKFEEVKQLVDEKQLSISQAYKLAHFDELSMSRGRQAAYNQAGKAHLGRTQGRGTGGQYVPPEEMALFRAINPRATDEEITRFYNSIQ